MKDAIGKMKEMKRIKKDDIVVIAFGKDMLDVDSNKKRHTNVIDVEIVE